MTFALRKIKRRGLAAAALVAAFALRVSIAWADAAALPAGIPFKSNSVSDDNLIYRAIAAFLVAVVIVFGLAWCIKRFAPSIAKATGRDKQLERLETMRLSARSMLVRIRWGSDELLIGEGEHGVTLIGSRPLPNAASIAGKAADAAGTKDE